MKPEKHTTKRERERDMEFQNWDLGGPERERVMQGKFKKKINVKTCNNNICMFRYIYSMYSRYIYIYIYLTTYMSM